jgi:hypothetical protein
VKPICTGNSGILLPPEDVVELVVAVDVVVGLVLLMEVEVVEELAVEVV